MKEKLYENIYEEKSCFSFGKNWQEFLLHLDNKKIESAKKSLTDFLGQNNPLSKKTFIDIGCGSGLFSLAAYQLGASKVVSIDVDRFAIKCANHLKTKNGSPQNWKIVEGSALNNDLVASLGKFDIVYSWGALHHTGNMYNAFDNLANLVEKGSLIYLAIYNNNTNKIFEGTSSLWLKIKKKYGQSGDMTKFMMEKIYSAYLMIGLMAHLKNPISYIKNYSSQRGMSFSIDIKDWLGGYPYEFSTADEIINFFENKENMKCIKLKRNRSLGCNEFLFKK
jgi:2-polyprenyl-3-methyl-5-hydroxy-6-metoxy-1,4-benzoquinol methylase